MKIETLHNLFKRSSGVCTDTRKITKDCIFFALKGDNFNGNTFAQEALEKGAMHVVIDDMRYHKNTGETIFCKDVLTQLQKLAAFHRKQLNIPIIGLTGSNGKTTSKELINAVLSTAYNVSATLGNLNNHIGVPLTLLAMTDATEIGIVEMGANHLKEIAQLSEIAQPNYGYITNFGKAHLEGFGSLDGVIRGKTELYAYLQKTAATAFVNANDPKQLEISKPLQRFTFGDNLQDCHVQLLDASTHVQIGYQGEIINSNLVGLYNFHNIAAAIAIGQYFKVATKDLKKAIEGYVPQNNRSQVIKKGEYIILLDAYNANPTSMLAALENLQQTEADKKVLILGDMFELGLAASEEHQNIVDFITENKIGTTYLVGENFSRTQTKTSNIKTFATFEDLKKDLLNTKIASSYILIKGSRGMALERVLDLL
ncbi:UDP-N-acetylmuramoyl-tripeptide--D-alanyl-D-alanine ligase [Rasiella rasia]|uniref:UDP-N-acetylmuramoyl-tripeptide--D-alanyl-D-alanine ligase n=1 Tax=Rasiella rasia TaxID=2744027 RepID=A0A6G6GPB7_9FLAO|nr:UDP-N-acetylmuramoyl-tripeptide--D-alanyl-D-alanine ligase [Rasiella rasia]QIE60324.1 UDP-N-acetylmuramoyl-tripeptide--D-alanyl-D-alanine ligase [Rasiella rasia]